eukprot:RCo050720
MHISFLQTLVTRYTFHTLSTQNTCTGITVMIAAHKNSIFWRFRQPTFVPLAVGACSDKRKENTRALRWVVLGIGIGIPTHSVSFRRQGHPTQDGGMALYCERVSMGQLRPQLGALPAREGDACCGYGGSFAVGAAGWW